MTDEEKKTQRREYQRAYYANNKQRWKKYNAEDRAKNRSKRKPQERDYDLKRKYGISVEQYEEMLSAQDHKCALCFSDTPGGKGSWHVDHCHTSGRVRGLLCQPCNTALGLLKDNTDTLLRAVDYLKAA